LPVVGNDSPSLDDQSLVIFFPSLPISQKLNLIHFHYRWDIFLSFFGRQTNGTSPLLVVKKNRWDLKEILKK